MSHAYQTQTLNKQPKKKTLFQGIGFTLIIAAIGFTLSLLPGFEKLGPLAIAIILAIIYRQFFAYPVQYEEGLQFTTKYLLRLAIILYGLKLNVQLIFQEGLGLIVKDVLIIALAILLMLGLARLFKADKNIALLTGVGTGVCGAAAILVIAPIVKSKDEDSALSVGMIALVGTVFSLIYLFIQPLLSLSEIDYGIWAGMSLHELAHVALSVAPFNEDVIAIAFLAKLGRVFLLIPLAFLFIYIMKRRDSQSTSVKNIAYPYFLLGFIGLSLLNSYLFEPYQLIPETVYSGLSTTATWLLTMAMVGLGLNVQLKDLQTRALRPFIILIVTSLIVSAFAYLLIT